MRKRKRYEPATMKEWILYRIGLTPAFMMRKKKKYRKSRFSLRRYISYVWRKELFQKFYEN